MKLRKADIVFSKWIRNRDKWRCQRCGHQHEENSRGLHCSHYWGRGRESSRFSPENCDALCFPCHRFWGHGDGRDFYKEFMIKKLGLKGFNNLKKFAQITQKKNDKLIIEKYGG